MKKTVKKNVAVNTFETEYGAIKISKELADVLNVKDKRTKAGKMAGRIATDLNILAAVADERLVRIKSIDLEIL